MRYTDEEVIFKYIDNDLALVKTATELGISHNTLRKILIENDIEIKEPGHRTSIGIGSRVGMLLVTERLQNRIYPSGSQDRQFLCKCDCGNEAIVPGAELRRASKTSCGCQNKTGIVKSTYTPEDYKDLVRKIDSVEKKTLDNLSTVIVSGIHSKLYQIGDKKGKMTILMRKSGIGSTNPYIDKWDELLLECECGEYTKMTYDEFMNCSSCGCENND